MNITEDDITTAAAPKSDQINADDLMSGPRIVTIEDVRKGSSEQPIEIVTTEFGTGRPYRPGKSMIRVLISAWGSDAKVYKGRRLQIYRDPEITFGRDKVGGIRISAMSHIDKRLSVALTVTRGKRAPFRVEPLADVQPAAAKEPDYAALEEWAAETENVAGLRSTIERLAPLTNDRAEGTRAIVHARIDHLTSETTDTTTQED